MDPNHPVSAIPGVILKPLSRHCDARGWLLELFRCDELPEQNVPRMTYVSETVAGVVRGPHEHTEQSDYFAFLGPGDFVLHLWDARTESSAQGVHETHYVGESNPMAAIIPPGVVHGYKNISDKPGWVFNAPNRLYAGPGKREQVDEIRHENRDGHPYIIP